MRKQLKEKIFESLASVLPITAIVLVLSITIAPVAAGTLVLFLFGALLLIFGMGIFTLGADLAMTPLGEGMGIEMSKSRKAIYPVLISFLFGVIITMAEPDLQVLAQQVPAIPNMVIVLSVAGGVGVFMMLAIARMFFNIPLSLLLFLFYGMVFLLAAFTPASFIPVSFDSGGVTTGPVTVPFIMSLGVGLSALRSDRHSGEDSFGLVALCSIGPVLAVLTLGIFYQPDSASYEMTQIAQITTTADAAQEFVVAFPEYLKEVAAALLPIGGMLFLFQLFTGRFRSRKLLKITGGLIYTYAGLVLFLTGVNVGFLPVGQFLGAVIGGRENNYLLIPIGMLMGYFIVAAEPAVHVLTRQVEEVSNGSISAGSMKAGLSVGVAVSVGISILRILTGIPILYFLVPGYLLSLLLTFFVPKIYTGIAFDSGGVASGPMT
ncbi:MAG: DUF1538 domain-containing protein, partial [Lachnospiraceae bacterium]|nr:DUF1538 domain-containing protein [Lachnospiraceae bacterium]